MYTKNTFNFVFDYYKATLSHPSNFYNNEFSYYIWVNKVLTV
jgi:hypothetical protein